MKENGCFYRCWGDLSFEWAPKFVKMFISALDLVSCHQNIQSLKNSTEIIYQSFLQTACTECTFFIWHFIWFSFVTSHLFTCRTFISAWHTVHLKKKTFKSWSCLYWADRQYFQFITYFLHFLPNIPTLTEKKSTFLWYQNRSPSQRCPHPNPCMSPCSRVQGDIKVAGGIMVANQLTIK